MLAQPQVSPTPQTTYEGIIEVRNLTDGSSLGYVSTLQRASGVFRPRPEIKYAVTITFSLDVGATSGSGIGFEMTVCSSFLSFFDDSSDEFATTQNAYDPLLGLVQGRENVGSDLSPDSYK